MTLRDHLRRFFQNQQGAWARTRLRFWREVARCVEPHMKHGLQINGIQITNETPVTASSLIVHGALNGTGVYIGKEPADAS